MAYSKPKPPKHSKKYLETVLANRALRKGQPEPLEGRKEPVKVTQKVIDDLCMHMAEFGEPMVVACRRVNISSVSSIQAYCKNNPEAQAQIEEARIRGVHTLAFGCREIARGRGESSRDVVRDRLIIETDMKILKAIAPREYGDRQSVEIEGKLTLEQLVLNSMKPTIIDVTPDNEMQIDNNER